MAAWAKNFLKTGAPDDEFAQFYELYDAHNPDQARVPTEHLEEFKRRRAGDFPGIWEIEEARACAPEARDVVPPAHAPSPPPSGSPSEPGDSTAEVIGTLGIKELDDCSFVLGTDTAPFNKYPDATGLRRILNTGTQAWNPDTLMNSGGMLFWVPNWREKPVLSGEEVVVGVAQLGDEHGVGPRDEPGKLKAARQPPPSSSPPSPPPQPRTGWGSRLRRFWHWFVSLCFCSCTTSPAAVYPADWPAPPGSPPPSPPPSPRGSDGSDSEEDEVADPQSGTAVTHNHPAKRQRSAAAAPAAAAAVEDGSEDEDEADESEKEDESGEENEAESGEEDEGEGDRPKYSADTCDVLDKHKQRKSKLVGLVDAKKTADNFIFAAIGRSNDSKIVPIYEDNVTNYNCLVLGESGVGKSTIVEKLLYMPLNDLGVLTGDFVVKSPSELQGKGALEKALEEANGGMLFIDEAYGLGSSAATTTQLVRLLLPSGGDVMVVAAGYQDKMTGWLNTNQGLGGRFNTLINIPSPTADELKSIGVGIVQEQGFAKLGEEELDMLGEAAEFIKSLPSSEAKGQGPRNANAIRCVVGTGGAVMHFYAEMGRRGDGVVSDKDKVLTKAHIEAGLASLKEYVTSVTAGSSGGGSSGAAGSSGATVDMRVAALKRLWGRTDPSAEQRLFRHAFYARIASREPEAWKTCGTTEQRENAIKDPNNLPKGSRPSKAIVDAWDVALAAAFDGLKFEHVRGGGTSVKSVKPSGYWTTELNGLRDD